MITCPVCPHHCKLTETSFGHCGARTEREGRSFPLNYGLATALHLDPIEKKPLLHFHPGKTILSYGSYGCNMRCTFCQNYTISTLRQPEGTPITPRELADEAIRLIPSGNLGVAFTYNEPTICPEFIIDTGRLVHEAGLLNVVVTNGFTSPETMEALLEVVDAFNIDLKAFREDFYHRMGGGLEPVKQSIAAAFKRSHVEVTTLVIPGENDSPEEMEEECQWLASLSKEIPLYLSRFFPAYLMMDKPPTPIATLKTLEAIACKYLTHVHLGNV